MNKTAHQELLDAQVDGMVPFSVADRIACALDDAMVATKAARELLLQNESANTTRDSSNNTSNTSGASKRSIDDLTSGVIGNKKAKHIIESNLSDIHELHVEVQLLQPPPPEIIEGTPDSSVGDDVTGTCTGQRVCISDTSASDITESSESTMGTLIADNLSIISGISNDTSNATSGRSSISSATSSIEELVRYHPHD